MVVLVVGGGGQLAMRGKRQARVDGSGAVVVVHIVLGEAVIPLGLALSLFQKESDNVYVSLEAN